MSEPLKTLITAEQLAFIRGERLLFKKLSFTLYAGQAMHVIGQNGSGKTSLFKVLMGVLPVDTGNLCVLGKKSTDWEQADYANIIYLGHKTAIKHELSVLENLSLNSELFDHVKASHEQLLMALSAVGLSAFPQQLAGKLSAGQKRRLMLARLWLTVHETQTEKALWLLDEPLTALDSGAIKALQTLIEQHLSLGGGVVFASHQALKLDYPIHSIMLGKS